MSSQIISWTKVEGVQSQLEDNILLSIFYHSTPPFSPKGFLYFFFLVPKRKRNHSTYALVHQVCISRKPIKQKQHFLSSSFDKAVSLPLPFSSLYFLKRKISQHSYKIFLNSNVFLNLNQDKKGLIFLVSYTLESYAYYFYFSQYGILIYTLFF